VLSSTLLNHPDRIKATERNISWKATINRAKLQKMLGKLYQKKYNERRQTSTPTTAITAPPALQGTSRKEVATSREDIEPPTTRKMSRRLRQPLPHNKEDPQSPNPRTHCVAQLLPGMRPQNGRSHPSQHHQPTKLICPSPS